MLVFWSACLYYLPACLSVKLQSINCSFTCITCNIKVLQEIKQIAQMYIKEQRAKYRSLGNTKDYILPGAIGFINFDTLFPINQIGMNESSCNSYASDLAIIRSCGIQLNALDKLVNSTPKTPTWLFFFPFLYHR